MPGALAASRPDWRVVLGGSVWVADFLEDADDPVHDKSGVFIVVGTRQLNRWTHA